MSYCMWNFHVYGNDRDCLVYQARGVELEYPGELVAP